MISGNYRELLREEVPAVNPDAWKDPRIPKRQYEMALRHELDAYRKGEIREPFAALLRCFEQMGELDNPKVLDIGAACGFASEILDRAGYRVRYTGVDFSSGFKDMAERLYPGIDFDVADARSLPYHDDYFDVVISSACIMHIREYPQAIREAVRVSRNFIVFHRTAVTEFPTTFFSKDAYGVKCLEVHINEPELRDLFYRNGCELVYVTEVYKGHRSYLLKKTSALTHQQV